MNIASIDAWIAGTTQPLMIAGPCSAETEEQLYTTAKAVKEQGVNIIRAGVWKPRTRPNTF